MAAIRFRRLLVSGLAGVLLAACGSDDDPEAALRTWVAEAEAFAEEKDRGGLLDMISEDYADGRGNDHEQIGNMLRLYFLRAGRVAFLTSIDEISIMDETAAMVNLTVGMAGTELGQFGINADAYRFELELENDDDEWVLIGARWGEVGRELR